ncbi:hypothetical protein D3C78_1723850 [compost metagenome]
MRVAKRHFDTHAGVAPQLLQQRLCTAFAHQYVQLQLAPGMRCRGQGEGRFFAIFPFDHQVLPGVIAWRLAGRRTQAHSPDIAPHVSALDHLARQVAYRQLTRR